jgi:shikimate dehydrogenase
VAAVIGDPVRHSLSPVLHNAAFRALDLDWVYLAFEVPRGQAAAAVTGMWALGIDGLSVTMPHKDAVAAAVDRLSPTALALGAVNTVVRRADVLEGHNTDGAGFIAAVRDDEGFDPTARRCLVLGAGGAARAVVKALADANAAQIVVVNRTRTRGEAVAALAGPIGRVGTVEEVAEAELIVNATPVGMTEDARLGAQLRSVDRTVIDETGPDPAVTVDPAWLGAGQLVVDLVYDPPLTPLVETARARGAAAVSGLGMLIHQAAHAFRLWTGEDPPLAVMSAAALAQLAKNGDDR